MSIYNDLIYFHMKILLRALKCSWALKNSGSLPHFQISEKVLTMYRYDAFTDKIFPANQICFEANRKPFNSFF